jgi:methylated-DNA-[protein]-cysteine S-methyltransferase
MSSIYTYTNFPLFDLKIRLVNNLLCRVEFSQKDPICAIPGEIKDKLYKEVKYQLDKYLEDPSFNFDLPVHTHGSAHQEKVWEIMRQIPVGSIKTYKEVAELLNSSAIAVGGACGKNPLVLITPCHRIVSANGSLGGFMNAKNGWPLQIKRWLLEHEGVTKLA